jgi:GNAT superfamily N-acetyltransferase
MALVDAITQRGLRLALGAGNGADLVTMIVLSAATTPEQITAFCAFPGSYPLTAQLPSMQQADAHWVAIEQDRIVARCSLWWTVTPPYPLGYTSPLITADSGKLGLIGHYAATTDAAAQRLLDHACRQLAAQGCTLAIGPLDGNTFRHYRFLTERTFTGSAHPPFFLEPDNPDAWPAHFLRLGFQPLAHYFSAHGALTTHDLYQESLTQRLRDHDITIRAVDLANFALELQRIYHIVLQSFTANFLFAPISNAEFTAQYAAVQSYIQPELVLIAEQGTEPVGFLFALPDFAQAQRGAPIDTIVIKTLGVVPRWSGVGLGGLLAAHGQTVAYRLGYRFAIHALMVEDNLSRKISERYARIMRRYTLLGKRLG